MPQITWADLPEEIQNKMLEHQKSQTGKRDESVFIKDIQAGAETGGITWDETPDEGDFWEDIINRGNFKTFFKRYPKPTLKQEEEVLTASKEYKHYPEPVEMMVSDDAKTWSNRKVVCELGGMFWVINSENAGITYYRHAKPIPQKIKLTAKDVSEGKGVGIQPELIEFV